MIKEDEDMIKQRNSEQVKTDSNRPWAGHRPPSPLSPPRGNFVHYNFLKLHYIRNKMTHVSPLAMWAFTCNSHVTNVTLKTIEIL